MRLSQWAALHGMHRMTAWRHYNAGTLPTELQAKKIGNIIYLLANPGTPPSRIAGYARVSSAEQKPHLENQANRLWAHSGQNRIPLDQVVSEVASGLNDRRPKLRKLLARPRSAYCDRRASGTIGPIWCRHGRRTMLQARGGALIVIDDAEVARRSGAGHDRDTDLLLRSSLRQTLRRQQGAEGDGGGQWLSCRARSASNPVHALKVGRPPPSWSKWNSPTGRNGTPGAAWASPASCTTSWWPTTKPAVLWTYGSRPTNWRRSSTPPSRSTHPSPSSPRSASSWPRARAATTATPAPAG